MLAAGSAALALAACHSSPPGDNIETNIIVNDAELNGLVENVAEPASEPANVTPAPAPAGAEFGNAEETMDDAEAVGMTSRVPRGEETSQPAQ